MRAYLRWSLWQLYLIFFWPSRFAREVEGDRKGQPHLRPHQRLRYLLRMLPSMVLLAVGGLLAGGCICSALGVAFQWQHVWFGVAGGVAVGAALFVAAGGPAVADAPHRNGASEWQLFAQLQDDGHLRLRVSLMEAHARAGDMPAAPQKQLSRGHVKIMLSEAGGALWPEEGELRRIVGDLHAAGRDVAIHAIEERAVAAAVDAIAAANEGVRRREHRHRIEHAALVPAGAAARMARAGVTVVTQPGFLHEHGDRYLRDVPIEKHSGLYPIGDFVREGVHVAASSDAPIGSIDVLGAMRSAIERRTAAGAAVAPEQAVSFEQAAAMWTTEAARAARLPERGQLRRGAPADLVLVAGGLERIEATFVAGEQVYRASA